MKQFLRNFGFVIFGLVTLTGCIAPVVTRNITPAQSVSAGTPGAVMVNNLQTNQIVTTNANGNVQATVIVTNDPAYFLPPVTNYVTNYTADPRLGSTLATVQGVANAAAPFNPYAPVTNTAITVFGSLITGASLLYAQYKNKKLSNAHDALDTIASVVHTITGASTAVMNQAMTDGTTATVAQHLENTVPTQATI